MKKTILLMVFAVVLCAFAYSYTPIESYNQLLILNNTFYYSMDNLSGTNSTLLINSVPNSVNGTIRGATLLNTGIISNSFNFTNNHMNISQQLVSTQITYSLWIKIANIQNKIMYIFENGYGVNGLQCFLRFRGDTTPNALDFECNLNNATLYYTATGGTGCNVINTWCHITTVHNGTGVFVYTNGALNTTSTSVGNTGTGTDSILTLGGLNGGSLFINATYDEFSIWNRALNATEIYELYNRQKDNALGAQYPFNTTTTSTPQILTKYYYNSTLNTTINYTSEGSQACGYYNLSGTNKWITCTGNDLTPTIKVRFDTNATVRMNTVAGNYTNMNSSMDCSVAAAGSDYEATCTAYSSIGSYGDTKQLWLAWCDTGGTLCDNNSLSGTFNYTILNTRNISSCQTLNESGLIYTLNKTISRFEGCIDISANNITLDCQNYGLSAASNGGEAIKITRSSEENTNIIIKNCAITGGTYGIYLNKANNVTVLDSSFSGIKADLYGISLIQSKNNNFINLNFSVYNPFDLDNPNESYCANTFTNVNGANNKSIYYYNSSINISNLGDNTFSEIILCNADNSNITNITNNYNSYLGRILTLSFTDNSYINNIVSYKKTRAIVLDNSNKNIFSNLIFNSSYIFSINVEKSINNSFSDIIFDTTRDSSIYETLSYNNIYNNIFANKYEDNVLYLYNTNNTIINNSRFYNCTDVNCIAINSFFNNNFTIQNTLAQNTGSNVFNIWDGYAVKLINVTVIGSNQYGGLYLLRQNDSYINGYYSSGHKYQGLQIVLSSGVIVENFEIYNNPGAGDWWNGFGIEINSNNMIVKNGFIYNNSKGIYIDKSNVLIQNVSITDNVGNGIYSASSNNNLTGCVISNNGIGFNSTSGSNWSIYNNYFNNAINFDLSAVSFHSWNTSEQTAVNIIGGNKIGGNYWANPTKTGFSEICNDTNIDSICDNSYTLASGNIDYLPLASLINVKINSPANATKFNNLTYYYNCSADSIYYVSAIKISIYNSTNSLVNSTTQTYTGLNNNETLYTALTVPEDGFYYWNCWTNSSTGLTDISDNYTIKLDESAPLILWYNPIGDTTIKVLNYRLNVSVTDIYLDMVNLSVYNSSNTIIYNNQSQQLNATVTTYWINDNLTFSDYGIYTLEVCARDMLDFSPKMEELKSTIKDDSIIEYKNTMKIIDDKYKKGYETVNTSFEIELELYDEKGKLDNKKQNLTSEIFYDGKHIKSKYDFNLLAPNNKDMVKGFYAKLIIRGKNIKYRELKDFPFLFTINDDLYYHAKDAKLEGWKFTYVTKVNNEEYSVILYKDTYIEYETIDPISGGLNTICENYTLTISDTNPTYSLDQSIIVSDTVTHSLYWEDDVALSGYIFSWCNGTYNSGTCSSGFINDTWTSMTGLTNWSNVSKTIPITISGNYSWCVYANDSINNWNGTSCINPFIYNYILKLPPYYASPSSSTAYTNEAVTHSLTLYDDVALSGYIFSWYNGTDWTNNSYSAISGLSYSMSESKTLNNNTGVTYNWCVYINNTNNLWNSTSCASPFSYVSQARPAAVIRTWQDDCAATTAILYATFVLISVGILGGVGFTLFNLINKSDSISWSLTITAISIIATGIVLYTGFIITEYVSVAVCS